MEKDDFFSLKKTKQSPQMNKLYLFILASRRQDSTLLQCLETETCKKKLSWCFLNVIKLFCNNVSLQIEVKKKIVHCIAIVLRQGSQMQLKTW